jgi:hypothetical protein
LKVAVNGDASQFFVLLAFLYPNLNRFSMVMDSRILAYDEVLAGGDFTARVTICDDGIALVYALSNGDGYISSQFRENR